jgi:hypothetical protein
MDDEVALSKVQGAFEQVKSKVGNDTHKIQEGLKKLRTEDPTLFEAFKQVGQLMQQTEQGH